MHLWNKIVHYHENLKQEEEVQEEEVQEKIDQEENEIQTQIIKGINEDIRPSSSNEPSEEPITSSRNKEESKSIEEEMILEEKSFSIRAH